MRYKLNGVIGQVDDLPGCTQVAVSHSVFVPPDDRHKGKGTKANALRLEMFREDLGYDYALCTIDQSNTAQAAVLANNGWTDLAFFKSSKTGHWVSIYGKDLTAS